MLAKAVFYLLNPRSNADTISNGYPVSSFQINLEFATKSFVAFLFITYFGYATFKGSLETAMV